MRVEGALRDGIVADWDAAEDKDGGQLVWWLVDENEQAKHGGAADRALQRSTVSKS